MTPEERLFNIILEEIRTLKGSVDLAQQEMRSEIKSLRADMHQRDLEIDRLKTKLGIWSAAIALAAAGAMQWAGSLFF